MAYLLGIDIGTSGTKTLLCDHDGGVAATALAEHDIASPHPGWSEQDPRQWWEATQKAVAAVLAQAKVGKDDITAIGLSGQMHGGVFLPGAGGEELTPLRPAILWNDQRTSEQCRQIEKKAGGRKALVQRVGNPALPGFTAPKILWVRKHEPKVYEKTRRVLLPKDYIRLCMTGEYATEVGDASGTLLLDVAHRAWSGDMLELLKIDRDWLPGCYESHEVSGKLHKAGARALGLREGTPVVGGSGDQPAGAIGNGIVRRGVVSATLGTSGVVFAHADKPIYDTGGPGGRVHTMCAAVTGQWCVFGCMLAAGGSFQWLRDHLAPDVVERAKAEGRDPYELLVELAQGAEPGCEGLFFLPYLTGERCPHPDPLARGGWIGLTARHDRPAIIRALLEGVTFGMNDALKIMTAMGLEVKTVRLSGGGARSEFWRQLQADIYNKPVATINAEEGPAYGAALLAGVGAGVWASAPEACDAAISETRRLTPSKKLARQYARWHTQYQRLYPALQDEFARIAEL